MAVLVVLMMVGPLPGLALCEDRCERGVPLLTHLRVLWSRSFKRVGEKREYACPSFTPHVSGYACQSSFTPRVSGYACPSSFTYLVCLI